MITQTITNQALIGVQEPPDSWFNEVPLERTAARYLWYGLATSTRSTYSTARRDYTLFCLKTTRARYPATVETLTSWSANLGDRNLKSKTIKAYLTGLRSHHIDIGYAGGDIEAFHHPTLQRVIAGIRRLQGDDQTRERRPITRDLLLQLLNQFDKSTIQGATWHASFCLAFAGFLRMGEFTWSLSDRTPDFRRWHITRSSVILHEDSLELTLPSSKTDPFRRGVTITIAATGDDAYAIASLANLTTKFPAPLLAPLFDPGYPYTRTHVTQVLRNKLANLNIEGRYSGHSFRRGAATSARRAGLSEDEIQLLGRWKSDSYRLYIEAHPSYILNASRRHQR